MWPAMILCRRVCAHVGVYTLAWGIIMTDLIATLPEADLLARIVRLAGRDGWRLCSASLALRRFLEENEAKLASVTIRANGRITYRLFGCRHRRDGPAIVKADGSTIWYFRGVIHRPEAEGPAIELACGAKLWVTSGQRHREAGPAAIWEDGSEDWYLRGVHLRAGTKN